MSKEVRTVKDDERLYNKMLNIATVILAMASIGVVILIIFAPEHL